MENPITDSHIHSNYSFDSFMSVESILKRSKKVGLDRIVITDHDQIDGSIKASKICKEYNIESIIGTEIRTDIGDIIGIYLNTMIKERDYISVIEEIKSQGGISILPHPYRDHKIELLPDIIKRVDIVEIWNSRCNKEENDKANSLAQYNHKKITCGSDAHCLSDIGSVKMPNDFNQYTLQDPAVLNHARLINIKRSRLNKIIKDYLKKI